MRERVLAQALDANPHLCCSGPDSTAPMGREAVKAGYYETIYGKYPKIQILTIAELFEGKQPNIPLVESAFKKAARESVSNQDDLPF